MARIVLFGNGPFAEMAYAYLKHDSEHEIAAFSVDSEFITAPTLFEIPVVPFEEIVQSHPPDDFMMFVPLGYAKTNQIRADRYAQAKALGYEFISYVSSTANTWPETTIGENCMVLSNNILQPFVVIGDNVMICDACFVGHHTRIMDHCFLAPHVAIVGSVTVEPYCFLGVNATVRNEITIKERTIVGAGALLLKSTQPRQVLVGQHATRVRASSDRFKI